MSDGVRDRLTVAGFRLAWWLVRRVPDRVAYAAFDVVADGSARRAGTGVRRLRANYARVRPDLDTAALDDLVRAGMRSYLRYWCDAFRLPDRDPDEVAASVRVVGDAPARAELMDGRPVVCFLGHMGNWDTAGAWACRHLAPVTTVAERLHPPEVFAQFLAFREALGVTVLPLGGAGEVFRSLLEAARGPAVIPLLADRDLTRRGVEVAFCGHAARMAVGPAALAVATGAALFPVSLTYEPYARGPGGHRLVITFHERVSPPAGESTRGQVVAMTQACADALGEAVTRSTHDWHMMQRVFVNDLDTVTHPTHPTNSAHPSHPAHSANSVQPAQSARPPSTGATRAG